MRLVLGYCKHIESDVGLFVRGGALLGIVEAGSTTDRGDDIFVTTRMTGVTVEGAGVLYPARRLFVGATL
jgi:hypothetical protein